MDFVRKIGKHTVLYGLSSIVGRVLNYLLVPLHTRILTPFEAGAITELYIYAAILNIFYLFSMDIAYFRFAKELDEKRAYHISYRIVLFTSIIISLIFYFSIKKNYILISGIMTNSLLVFIIILFSDSISNLFLARLRYNNRAGLFSAIQIMRILLNIILNIIFLYGHKILDLSLLEGSNISEWLLSHNNFVEKIIMANLLSSISILIISQILNIRSLKSSQSIGLEHRSSKHDNEGYLTDRVSNSKNLRLTSSAFDDKMEEHRSEERHSYRFYKKFFKFSYPLVFVGVVGLLNELISRPMLKYLLPRGFYMGYSSQDILGIYASCYKLSIFMNLAVQAFRYAAEPLFFRHNDDLENFRSAFDLFIIFSALIFVGVSLNLDLIAVIMLGPEYRLAIEIVPFLLLSYSFMGAYFSFSIWFKIRNKTVYSLVISSICLLMIVMLNLYLIPKIGYWGCIVSQLISFGSMSILGYVLSNRLVSVKYDIPKALKYSFLAVATVVTYRIFAPHRLVFRVPMGLILSLGYLFLVVILERSLIFQLFNQRFKK